MLAGGRHIHVSNDDLQCLHLVCDDLPALLFSILLESIDFSLCLRDGLAENFVLDFHISICDGLTMSDGKPYISIVPVSELIVEHLILSLLQLALDPRPACANGFGVVVDSTLSYKTVCDVLLLVFGILHCHNEFIVRVEVCRDLLCSGRATALYTRALDDGDRGAS